VRNIIKFSAARFQFRSALARILFARGQAANSPRSNEHPAIRCEMISCTHRVLSLSRQYRIYMMLGAKLSPFAENRQRNLFCPAGDWSAALFANGLLLPLACKMSFSCAANI
jgi:hypothetical protein